MPATESPATDVPAGRRDRRARRFARFWKLVESSVDELARPAKDVLFADLPDHVVEIGPGRGANFAYYPPGTRVTAFEPNTFFHDPLRAAATEHGIDLDLRGTDLDGGALPAGSCEAVVSTFVLCTVGDIDGAVAEIHRVLRPGGQLLFVEHVAAPAGSGRSWYQRLVRRPWRALGDGCDPHPDTVGALARSPLTVVEPTLEPLGSRLDPTSPTYWGRAVK